MRQVPVVVVGVVAFIALSTGVAAAKDKPVDDLRGETITKQLACARVELTLDALEENRVDIASESVTALLNDYLAQFPSRWMERLQGNITARTATTTLGKMYRLCKSDIGPGPFS